MTFSTHIRKLDTRYKTFTKPNYIAAIPLCHRTFRLDEEALAQDELLEKMCIGVIIVASLFISSISIMLFLR